MAHQVHLTAFDLDAGRKRTRYRCDVAGLGTDRELVYDVSSTTGHKEPSLTANWAVKGLLIPAMRAGLNMRISGLGLSPLLLHFLRTDIQDLLIRHDARLTRVEIDADLAPEVKPGSGSIRIGTGFSAGVDSFSALLAFQHSDTASALDVTDLLTFDVGAFSGSGGASRKQFEHARRRMSEYASAHGLHAHSVSSNLDEFYPSVYGPDFIRTHTLRNASAASLFERELDIYLYASTFAYSEIDLAADYDLAHLDPILLPLLSTPSLRFVSSGAGSDRIRKTRILADFGPAQDLLDVCVKPAKVRQEIVGPGLNCSRCWKCVRTIATLEAMGKLDSFGRVFDLPHYRANREALLSKLKRRARAGSTLDKAAYQFHEDVMRGRQ